MRHYRRRVRYGRVKKLRRPRFKRGGFSLRG